MDKTSQSLELEEVFSSQEPLLYPQLYHQKCIYLSTLTNDSTKSVLKARLGSESICISPEEYSLRTKINEYGGKPFWVVENGVVFSNQTDQCLYLSKHRTDDLSCLSTVRLTPLPTSQNTYMYSDVHQVSLNHYIAVVERHNAAKGGALNECFIGLIDANSSDNPPQRLIEGADFYSNLVVDDNNQIAWVQWSHPNMPWDNNTLYIARLNDQKVSERREVRTNNKAKGPSHCQTAFNERGDLFFSVDFQDSKGADNYWNVFVLKHETGYAQRVTQMEIEFGYPHWQYGDCRISGLDGVTMLAIGSKLSGDAIYRIDPDSEKIECLYSAESTINHLSVAKKHDASQGIVNSILFSETGAQTKPSIVELSIANDDKVRRSIVASADYSYPVSSAIPLAYETSEGDSSYGFYYAPIGPHDIDPDARTDAYLPPLLVMVHGGPTARAYGHFDIQKQYWCAKGFAILDINHRGSSGFGRDFRDSLYGHWGVRDTQDIIAGISHLVGQGLVDERNVFIRGKSAGGYAVLRALTEYPDVFNGGACYYGIGNLATLSEVTHKFEKHYTDRLIGEPYTPETASLESSNYRSRSPNFFVDRIRSSMIIFQGGADKVVPPTVAHEMINSLKQNQVKHEYVEYSAEGHGFKHTANNIDAWTRELAFYRSLIA